MIKTLLKNEIKSIKTITISIALGVIITACSSTTAIRKTGNDVTDMILQTADNLKGSPYCSNGQTPDCFDCSGFVFYCFQAAHLTVPRTSSELFATGQAIRRSELAPGDLVFFNTSGKGVSHVGIYIGDNSFIHSSTSNGVMISSMDETYWKPKFVGCRRVVK